jgi:hypothetical protein
MRTYPIAALTVAIALCAAAPVRASVVRTGVPPRGSLTGSEQSLTGGAVSLLDTVGFMGKGQVFTDAINVPSAGTLTVKLAGISWLDALQNLNCFVSAPGGGIIGNANNGGLDSVQVQPGTVYVNWYGQASAPLFLGVYSLSVDFQPAAPPPPAVALPPALLLLLSGLTALALGFRRPGVDLATG